MQTDPWLSETRREAQRQREWCLRDRGGRQHTQHDVLWSDMLWALTSRAALVVAGCGVVVWMLIEWLA